MIKWENKSIQEDRIKIELEYLRDLIERTYKSIEKITDFRKQEMLDSINKINEEFVYYSTKKWESE